MANQESMRAVIFEGPFKVSVQDRPIPQLQYDSDIIVKVTATALCGSELHLYRGNEPSDTGYIMGHEFTGIVTQVGSKVTTVQAGDHVVVPFTVSCLKCFYCKSGWSSRCERSLPFGSSLLDGGQAEYVRVPYADGTVIKAPSTIASKMLVLMADIFPTGFFGTRNAFNLLGSIKPADAVVAVVGCGPVGLCAIVSALEYKPKHLIAIDSVESRLELAKSLGAEAFNFATDYEAMKRKILELSDGRGADAVVEVVGLSPALRTAYDIVRPCGVISSIGVHNAEIPWSGAEAYGKNIRVQMGRCPVRSIFPEALEVLAKSQDKLSVLLDTPMPLEQATEAYDLFEKRMVQKVVFNLDN